MGDEFNTKHGNEAEFEFTVSNPDTGTSNTDLSVAGGVGSTQVMPKSGSVVGIAVKSNANVSAGTITFKGHKASTEWPDVSALAIELNSGAGYSNKGYGTVRPGVMTFDAGDEVGVSYTSDADYAPTTVDFDVTLYVIFDEA